MLEMIDKQIEETKYPSGYLKSQVHVATGALKKLREKINNYKV